jgi:hypothetical protein
MERTRGIWWRGVCPHGLVCGFLMVTLAFLTRTWDAPVPLFAAVLCTPYCAVPGFLTARRDGAGQGVAVAAVTAATGHVIVFLGAAGYSATNQPWPKPLLWGLTGLLSLAVTFLLGMFFGRIGTLFVRRRTFTLPVIRPPAG